MIGLFDSGLGGLSVLSAIARALPQADLLYLADTAQVPYGDKPEAFIRARVLTLGAHLVAEGCSTLVVACNTATVAAVQSLRQAHPTLAVIGIEPGIKPAAAASRTGHIAVLATESTARSPRLQTLIKTHASHLDVHVTPCPGWATRVETLHLADPNFADDIAGRIQPLLDRGVNRIVLGCTHYAFLAPLIQPLIHGRAQLVEVADAVAREVVRRTAQAPAGRGHLILQATARPAALHAALPALGLQPLLTHLQAPARLISL